MCASCQEQIPLPPCSLTNDLNPFAGPIMAQPQAVHVSAMHGWPATRLAGRVSSPGDAWATEAAPGTKVELDVHVAYTAGCPRSHTARLVIPVMPPFRCHGGWGHLQDLGLLMHC